MMSLKIVQETIARHPTMTGARLKPLPGQDRTRMAKLVSSHIDGFVKWGTGTVAKGLSAEYCGLTLLRTAGHPLKIPSVIRFFPGDQSTPTILVLEWLNGQAPDAVFSELLGQGLAALHRNVSENGYGLDLDNFIGPTEQVNGFLSSWPVFFRENRLEPMRKKLEAARIWQSSWSAPYTQLLDRLAGYLPANPASSLLHGDLWSGNVICLAGGQPALIDPATYYGDRETDMAMTHLFGGFDERFYHAYVETWPLDPGSEHRVRIYNLYHLMNHLLLFGFSYAASVDETLRSFAR